MVDQKQLQMPWVGLLGVPARHVEQQTSLWTLVQCRMRFAECASPGVTSADVTKEHEVALCKLVPDTITAAPTAEPCKPLPGGREGGVMAKRTMLTRQALCASHRKQRRLLLPRCSCG
eukprot:jgi/Ulvmu1/7443/UM036_0105.1